jgi:hypothetical protein
MLVCTYKLATMMLYPRRTQYEMYLLLKMCKTYTLKVFFIGMHRRWNSALNVQFLEQHPKQMNHCHALPPCLVLWPRGLRLLVVAQTACMLCYVPSSHWVLAFWRITVCLHLCGQKVYLLGLLDPVNKGTDPSECHTPEDWNLRITAVKHQISCACALEVQDLPSLTGRILTCRFNKRISWKCVL